VWHKVSCNHETFYDWNLNDNIPVDDLGCVHNIIQMVLVLLFCNYIRTQDYYSAHDLRYTIMYILNRDSAS